MERMFIGYHGTRRDLGQSILKSSCFKLSIGEEEWLGIGIYFFEDDIGQARDFCTRARRYGSYMIIRSQIVSSNVIDLLNSEHLEAFNRIAKTVKDRYKKLRNGEPRELLNSVILNIMYKISPYEVVRAAFPVEKRNTIYRTNIIPIQIQLCVRDKKCIKSCEEVN